MRVSVIVAARDAAATLPRTLEALAGQRIDEPYEVIVVDDGSQDETSRLAEAAGPPTRVLRRGPEGASAARNRGAAVAQGETLAFTDADCFPDRGWLVAGLRARRTSDLVCGAVKPDPRTAMRPFDRSLHVERETGLYESANLFVSRELFDRVGGFEQWLFDEGRPLGEDVWLGWRARRAGARTAFCPEAIVHHAVIRRGPAGYVKERQRLRHFPHMARRIPELREQFFFARYFLSSRTAAFDGALLALATARVTRSWLPLLGTAPYLRYLARKSYAYRRAAPVVAGVEVVAGAVGLAALLRGSLRWRTPLL